MPSNENQAVLQCHSKSQRSSQEGEQNCLLLLYSHHNTKHKTLNIQLLQAAFSWPTNGHKQHTQSECTTWHLKFLLSGKALVPKGPLLTTGLPSSSCSHLMPPFKKKFSKTFQSRGSSDASSLVSLQIILLPLKDSRETSETSPHRAPCPDASVRRIPKLKEPPSHHDCKCSGAVGLSHSSRPCCLPWLLSSLPLLPSP